MEPPSLQRGEPYFAYDGLDRTLRHLTYSLDAAYFGFFRSPGWEGAWNVESSTQAQKIMPVVKFLRVYAAWNTPLAAMHWRRKMSLWKRCAAKKLAIWLFWDLLWYFWNVPYITWTEPRYKFYLKLKLSNPKNQMAEMRTFVFRMTSNVISLHYHIKSSSRFMVTLGRSVTFLWFV